MSTKSVDQIILAITAWLEPGNEERALATVRGWDAADWALARKVVFFHGVGPYLHQCIPLISRLQAGLAVEFRDYLANQSALNAARIERVHAELSAILAIASRNGIEVIPLKGSLITTQGQIDPKLRPMGDIDLLIRPADQQAMMALLERAGYHKERPKMIFSHHDHYIRPQERVVSWEGEHPDNPLPVEIHTSLRRVLWGDIFTPDLTASLWESARPGGILGQPVLIPDAEAHYAYLCLHALVHLMATKGRLAHWLTLAWLAPGIHDFSRLPYPGLLYPILRLANRALPAMFAGSALEPMADRVQPRVRNWADRIPLNGGCGLMNQHRLPSWIEERWEYWHPTTIRLALAYPETPLPTALMRFSGKLTHHLVKRVDTLLTGREG